MGGDPPGRTPAVLAPGRRGEQGAGQTIGNDGTQSQGLRRLTALCSTGCTQTAGNRGTQSQRLGGRRNHVLGSGPMPVRLPDPLRPKLQRKEAER